MTIEQVTIRDSIYNNVINTSSYDMFNTIVVEIHNKNDGSLLGTWDINQVLLNN